jgi:hypothetical protein
MKTTTYRNAVLSIVAKGCLIFAAAVTLVPSSADGQCAQWDASGIWALQQSNGPFVTMKLRQNGKVLTGTASYEVPETQDTGIFERAAYTATGSVDGTIAGNDFNVQIYWDQERNVGVYRGKVGPQGRLEGSTNLRGTSKKFTWFSTTTIKCADAPAPAAPKPATSAGAPLKPVPPKPVKPNNARPPNWDVGGEWQLSQSDGKTVTLTLKDNEGDFRGSATVGKPNAPGYTHGKVEGFVTGDTFSARVTWAATLVTKADWVADYSGTIGPQGMILGSVKGGPSIQQNWSSLTAMTRLSAMEQTAESAKPPRFTPMKNLRGVGAARGAEPPPAEQRAPSATGVPRIAANPIVVSIPAGESEGTTTLAWDGGADHPYAEVWVKVDDGDETKVVEQGKGNRTMTVKAGKTYTYILTDAGQQLATVRVRAKQ